MPERDGLHPAVPDQIETYRIDGEFARSGATGVVVSAVD